MASVSIHVVSVNDPAYHGVWQLREEVLRQPLGLSLRDEDLSGEALETILAALNEQTVLACLHMQPLSTSEIKLRQMAVEPAQQGQGLGSELLQKAEELASSNGYTLISLHARQTAVPFYQKAGYAVVGDVFTEVGIPHLLMHKAIHEKMP
jgi:predicted GNAT family N-acyltransferase